MQKIAGLAGLFGGASVGRAACLPGDLSKECIGFYKVPMDDSYLKYFGTPEAVKTNAPDLNYVPPIRSPKNYKQAVEILETQLLAAKDIQQVVLAGRLEEAGIKVLNLVPQVTVAGRLVVGTIKEELLGGGAAAAAVNEMRILKLEQQLELVMGLWGECDIEIGQGLRGDMGVSAVAQIQILSSLGDAIAALDDLLFAASHRTG
jgi:hypothetical protein